VDIRVKEELMSAGLFALSCPDCGAELEITDGAEETCVGCGSTYLIRFGHLIPMGSTTVKERLAVLAEG
jgi:hypothetical protein